MTRCMSFWEADSVQAALQGKAELDLPVIQRAITSAAARQFPKVPGLPTLLL